MGPIHSIRERAARLADSGRPAAPIAMSPGVGVTMGRPGRLPAEIDQEAGIVATLREFLASEAEKLRGEQAEMIVRRDEWLASVGRLFAKIQEWLRDADPGGGLLTLEEGRVAIREVGIGGYEAPVLFVKVGRRQATIRPVARNVAGALASTNATRILKAYGRVDMESPLGRYMLFRTQKEPEDRWIVIEEDGYRSQAFDRDTFESAFQGLLA